MIGGCRGGFEVKSHAPKMGIGEESNLIMFNFKSESSVKNDELVKDWKGASFKSWPADAEEEGGEADEAEEAALPATAALSVEGDDMAMALKL